MRQHKRHWCIEQSFGLCGRGRGWDDLGEWHWNTYNIIYETSSQSRFDARYWMLGAGALGRPRGMVQGGRREEGSGWGTRVYLWWIHVDIWQNQYNIVKLKKKKKTALSCVVRSQDGGWSRGREGLEVGEGRRGISGCPRPSLLDLDFFLLWRLCEPHAYDLHTFVCTC